MIEILLATGTRSYRLRTGKSTLARTEPATGPDLNQIAGHLEHLISDVPGQKIDHRCRTSGQVLPPLKHVARDHTDIG